jgi:hypothetical protein
LQFEGAAQALLLSFLGTTLVQGPQQAELLL